MVFLEWIKLNTHRDEDMKNPFVILHVELDLSFNQKDNQSKVESFCILKDFAVAFQSF